MRRTAALMCLLFFVCGCVTEDHSAGAVGPSSEPYDQRYDFSEYELIEGADSVVLKIPRHKLGDVYVEKTIEYGIDGRGEITLEIEGGGVYVETVPKSFAASAGDMEFSVEPDRIIKEDPVVEWMLDRMDSGIKRISIKVGEAAYSSGVGGGLGSLMTELGKFGTGEKVDLSNVQRAGLEDAANAGLDAALDHLEDFIFISDLSICAGKDVEYQELCLQVLINKHPGWFDCGEIYGRRHDQVGSCEAIQRDDISRCETLETSEDCRAAFFAVKITKCAGLQKDARDGCIKDLAKDLDYPEGCKVLGDLQETECEKNLEEEAPSAGCEDMREGVWKDACWKRLAIDECDASYCNIKFPEERDMNVCLEGVARECGIDYCGQISEEWMLLKCYWTLAKAPGDCDLLGDADYYDLSMGRTYSKETCLQKLSMNS